MRFVTRKRNGRKGKCLISYMYVLGLGFPSNLSLSTKLRSHGSCPRERLQSHLVGLPALERGGATTFCLRHLPQVCSALPCMSDCDPHHGWRKHMLCPEPAPDLCAMSPAHSAPARAYDSRASRHRSAFRVALRASLAVFDGVIVSVRVFFLFFVVVYGNNGIDCHVRRDCERD